MSYHDVLQCFYWLWVQVLFSFISWDDAFLWIWWCNL